LIWDRIGPISVFSNGLQFAMPPFKVSARKQPSVPEKKRVRRFIR
jgi:hypothetical protein